MKKLIYFVMVGLFFTVLQVASVEAQEQFVDPDCPPGTPAGTTCMPGAPNMPPTTMAPPVSTMPPTTAAPMGEDPCMVHPVGPARDTCYANAPAPPAP